MGARRFVAIFAVVALSFIGASLYSQRVEVGIDDYATDIAYDAAPSIERLTEIRDGVREIQVVLAGVLRDHAPLSPDQMANVRSLRAAIDEGTRRYLALPAFVGEAQLWGAAEEELGAFNRVVDDVLDRLQKGDRAGAARAFDQELSDIVERFGHAVSRSVALNAAEAHDRALSIETTRQRAVRTEYILDTLSAGLAVVAAFLLARSVRQHTTLLESHSDLLRRRAEELEQFAGRVAHDILSPLAGTALALGSAEKALGHDSRASAAVARGRACLRRVERTVNGLLEFARAGARPLPGASAALATVLEDVLEDIRPEAQRAAIELEVEPFEPCEVRCSPGMLASLIGNLARNAVKYMGDSDERRVSIGVKASGSSVRLEVADTGPGIAEQFRDTIFVPYFRVPLVNGPGIGLGLATVQRIAETHGGKVGVHSRVGRGSVFWFELPRAVPSEASKGGGASDGTDEEVGSPAAPQHFTVQ